MSASPQSRSAASLQSCSCLACGNAMQPFFEMPGVPVNSCLLVDTHERALQFPRGDIVLGYCPSCGFISNVAFDPKRTEYSGRYEETQAYSGTFNKFHQTLATDLVERFGLRGKTVVEVGCGKGEFLALLCRLGGNRGIGYDPSFDPERHIFEPGTDVRVLREFYGKGSGTAEGDLVCCKMTLEHIKATREFAETLRDALKPGGQSSIFIQIPESLRILRECAFEDIYYEHCSYFTPGSLARLFRRAGFVVDRLSITYGAQYLTLEGHLAEGQTEPASLAEEESLGELTSLVSTFPARVQQKIADWRRQVAQASRDGPVALWGSGSKAVAFLRAIEPESRTIEHVVDINPHRQGNYMPGTGQRILSPAELRAVAPRTVIAMNAIYRNEIAAELDRQGVGATLLAL